MVSGKDTENQQVRSWSGIPLKEVYDKTDLKGFVAKRDLGDPGSYPFTRGIHKNMYRGRMWTRREVSGFGGGVETNERLRYQLAQGFTGLSVVLDMPTDFCIDPDHPVGRPEVGASGIALPTLYEMEAMVAGIQCDRMTMSFDEGTPPSDVTMAQYILAAQKQGVSAEKLTGTIQNDPLHLIICGGGLWRTCYPVDLSLKLAVDLIEYCSRNMPMWNTGTVNAYDLQDAGDLTASQEIAVTFALAITYIEESLKRGLSIDDFAPRRAFYVCSNIDVFETAAKLRAARRMWAKLLKERYGAKNPRSWLFRFGVHTSGTSLVAPQPLNNIVRVAYEAMAGALGGAQSINTCAYDEPVSLPSELGQMISVRTQQILAYETGVTRVVDPLGGSYYVESLTNQIEEEAQKTLDEIEGMGGAVEALKKGWFDNLLNQGVLRRHKALESKEQIIVGLNDFVIEEEQKTPGGYFVVEAKRQQRVLDDLKRLRETRDGKKLVQAIKKLKAEAEKGEKVNLMPVIIEAVGANATIGEIVGTIRQVYGYSYDPFKMVSSPF